MFSRRPESVTSSSSTKARTCRRLIGDAALVEILQDALAVAGQQVGRDLRQTKSHAAIVQLAANQAQERRLDLQLAPVRHRLGWPLPASACPGRSPATKRTTCRPTSGVTRSPPGLVTASRARVPFMRVKRIRFSAIEGIDWPQALQVRQIILAQADEHPVVPIVEDELLDQLRVVLQSSLQALPAPGSRSKSASSARNVRGRGARFLAGLADREHLLELVEDQDQAEPAGRQSFAGPGCDDGNAPRASRSASAAVASDRPPASSDGTSDGG